MKPYVASGVSRMDDDFSMSFVEGENEVDPHDSLLMDIPPLADKQIDADFFNDFQDDFDEEDVHTATLPKK